MLFLLFHLGADRYAIEARRVIEVLPLVEMKGLPRAPVGIAGVINYRGAPVPVLDLAEWSLQRPAAERLSTRLLIVPLGAGGDRLVALRAEKATETKRMQEEDFVSPGVSVTEARYLGRVAKDTDGRLVQWVEVEKLLPADVREALFQQVESVA